jgi:hypothetical protein
MSILSIEAVGALKWINDDIARYVQYSEEQNRQSCGD